MRITDVVKPAAAVVIGGQLNGLGVVRSLAKGGVQSIVVDTSRNHPAMWSHWAKGLVVQQLYGRSFVDNLLELQSKLGFRPVLIATDENSVETISEYRTEVAGHYRISLPPQNVVATLGNKALFHRFAEQHGLPVPRTVILEAESDIEQLSSLSPPIILKPANKLLVHLGIVEHVSCQATYDGAITAARLMLKAAGALVAQEWIDGPDGHIFFSLFHCGRSVNSRHIFTGRKIASDPPGTGMTGSCVAAPEADSLLRPITEKFIEISQYQGLGSIEFKMDSDRFVIIEPTVGRTDWQEEIATINGVNLPLIAYSYELSLPVPQQELVRPAGWCASFRHRRNLSALNTKLRIFDGYWRVNDPLPAIIFYLWSMVLRHGGAAFARPIGRLLWRIRSAVTSQILKAP